MIGIQNKKEKKNGKTKYEVWVTDADGEPMHICYFWHDRKDGIGICLLEASKAVEKENMTIYRLSERTENGGEEKDRKIF